MLRVLDLFSGVGGFSLGLERTGGFETVAFCEIEPYAQKVLNKHWPKVPIYDDVRTLTADRLVTDGIGVDVITGGFPCTDISVAGKQAGIDGEQSGLWKELARLIGDIRPRYAIMENVSALLSGGNGRWFGRVLGDLAALGYDAEWHCIPASELGAHHHRDRVWIVVYPSGELIKRERCGNGHMGRDILAPCGRDEKANEFAGSSQDVANANGFGHQRFAHARDRQAPPEGIITRGTVARASDACRRGIWASEPNVGRVANGLPNRSHRLRCLGNAVVPQIPELIGRAILESERAQAL